MTSWKALAFSFVAVAVFLVTPAAVAPAHAQIAVGVDIGAPPICPYGYFDYPPYDCAPYGYYGPDWFVGGVFLGAGPWFHGPRGFYGHVDNRYDPRHGYHGPVPERNAVPFAHFQGNEARDARGNVGNAGHAPTNEHSPGFSGRGRPGGGGRPR